MTTFADQNITISFFRTKPSIFLTSGAFSVERDHLADFVYYSDIFISRYHLIQH